MFWVYFFLGLLSTPILDTYWDHLTSYNSCNTMCTSCTIGGHGSSHSLVQTILCDATQPPEGINDYGHIFNIRFNIPLVVYSSTCTGNTT